MIPLLESSVSVLCGAGAAGLLLRWSAPRARRWKLLDHPSGRKAHRGAVPLVGGLGLAAVLGLAWLGAWWSAAEIEPLHAAATLGALACFGVGLHDDRSGKTTRARTKAMFSALALFGVVAAAAWHADAAVQSEASWMLAVVCFTAASPRLMRSILRTT